MSKLSLASWICGAASVGTAVVAIHGVAGADCLDVISVSCCELARKNGVITCLTCPSPSNPQWRCCYHEVSSSANRGFTIPGSVYADTSFFPISACTCTSLELLGCASTSTGGTYHDGCLWSTNQVQYQTTGINMSLLPGPNCP